MNIEVKCYCKMFIFPCNDNKRRKYYFVAYKINNRLSRKWFPDDRISFITSRFIFRALCMIPHVGTDMITAAFPRSCGKLRPGWWVTVGKAWQTLALWFSTAHPTDWGIWNRCWLLLFDHSIAFQMTLSWIAPWHFLTVTYMITYTQFAVRGSE